MFENRNNVFRGKVLVSPCNLKIEDVWEVAGMHSCIVVWLPGGKRIFIIKLMTKVVLYFLIFKKIYYLKFYICLHASVWIWVSKCGCVWRPEENFGCPGFRGCLL